MAVRKTEEGAKLKRWFKEKWVDVKTGKPCGRQQGEKRDYPYCRPSKRVSKDTPKTSSELSASEKRSRTAAKKSSKKVKRVQEDTMIRWLRNTKDGEIYEWDEILAENPLTEEVTEEQAFPEKFLDKKKKNRKAKVNLETEVPEVGDDTPEELAEEATRGLERARNDKGHYVKDDPTTPQNEAWVKKK